MLSPVSATKMVVDYSDDRKRAQWIANGQDAIIPKKLKRANHRLTTQPTREDVYKPYVNPLIKKSNDFELGPRLKSISLDTDDHVIWPGAMRNGYGVKKMGNTTVNAHRHVYETATGKKIPKGWHIDHKCRERRCINPKHLEPVSPGENKRRAWQSKYFREGNHDKVTDKNVAKAYKLPSNIAREFDSLHSQAGVKRRKALKPLSDNLANKLFADKLATKRKLVSKASKLKIGALALGASSGAVYGTQVTRSARAVNIDRNTSNADAKAHNVAADKWVKEGKSGKKKYKLKYYDKNRKEFAQQNPESKKLRPTIRHWEDSYREVQRIRDAKPIDQSKKNIIIHPIKIRRYSDKKVITRLANNGTEKGNLYRTMTLDKSPKEKRVKFTPLSSWTPHKEIADNFAVHQDKFNKLGIQRWNNAPKSLDKDAKPYILKTKRKVKTANIAPISRFNNVDERISTNKVIPVKTVKSSIDKSIALAPPATIKGIPTQDIVRHPIHALAARMYSRTKKQPKSKLARKVTTATSKAANISRAYPRLDQDLTTYDDIDSTLRALRIIKSDVKPSLINRVSNIASSAAQAPIKRKLKPITTQAVRNVYSTAAASRKSKV